MTELSFTEHAANQVANNNSSVAVSNDTIVEYNNDDSECYEEKHVTIDEELPVVYKPKSFSVPDLLDDTTYEGSKHQHPALKFSISSSNTTDTSAFLRKWFPKEKTTTCSPLAARRHKIKDDVSTSTPSPTPLRAHKKKNNKDTSILSSLWSSKSELSRSRGKTHPQYTTSSSDSEQTQQQQEMVDSTKVLSTKRRSLSTNTYDPKWLSFWRKINIFKLNKNSGTTTTNNYNNSSHNNNNNKRGKKKKTSKSAEPSFDDLPPIRCTVSHSDLLRDTSRNGECDEANNNSNCNDTNIQHSNNRSREGERLFSVSKSYKPTEQCCKNNTDDQLSSAVKLKRIRSLPIL